MGIREAHRERTVAAILEAARGQIAEHGGVGLSMRAVAREVGLVSSAIYRYYPTREALLTALVIESYEHLAHALGQVDAAPASSPAARWAGLATTFRAWARAHPQEFQLIYGTPIPGYVAPPETIAAAAAVARPFLVCGAAGPVAGFDDPALLDQLGPMADDFGVDPSGAAAVLAEMATLVGAIGLELAGHLVGSADPADQLMSALVDRQISTLGLDA